MKLLLLICFNIAVLTVLPVKSHPLLDSSYDNNKHLAESINDSGNLNREIISPPDFSVPPGIYHHDFDLELVHPDTSVTIYYTLDGSLPFPDSLNVALDTTMVVPDTSFTSSLQDTVPSGPDFTDTTRVFHYDQLLRITDRSDEPNRLSAIPTNFITGTRGWIEPSTTVPKGTVIRAVAVRDSMVSEPVTGTYYVFEEGAAKFSLPVVSITTDSLNLFGDEYGIYVPGDAWVEGDDGTGNFSLRGPEYERPAYFELMNSDGTAEYSQNIGIRIHGGFTRRFPQKSFRLYARSEYGESRFRFPVFPEQDYEEYNRLLLRNSGNDFGYTMFMDAAAQSLVRHFNLDTQAYRPSVLFINGEFWGIKNFRERYDRHYIARVYSADPDNIDLLTRRSTVIEGSNEHYLDMLNYAVGNDLSHPAAYDSIRTMMDIDNYLDYYSAQIYYGNRDWPQNNIDFWRYRSGYNPNAPHGQDGRWRWLLFDTDVSLGWGTGPDFDMIDWIIADVNPRVEHEWPNLLFRNLLDNESFFQDFVNRVSDHLNTAFVPERVKSVIDSLRAPLDPAIDLHIARWENHGSREQWEENVAGMYRYAGERPEYVREHLAGHFELGRQIPLTVETALVEGTVETASTGDTVETASTGDTVGTASTGDSMETAQSGGTMETAQSGGTMETASTGGTVGTPSTGGTMETAQSGGTVETASTGGNSPGFVRVNSIDIRPGTPGIDHAVAPTTDHAGAPATDHAVAPDTDHAGAPATDQAGAPATDLTGAPATDQAGAPATDLTGTLEAGSGGSSWTGIYFENVPVRLKAVSGEGYRFSHWETNYNAEASGHDAGSTGENIGASRNSTATSNPDADLTDPELIVSLSDSTRFRAVFVPDDGSGNGDGESNDFQVLHSWIFTDALPNDTPLWHLETAMDPEKGHGMYYLPAMAVPGFDTLRTDYGTITDNDDHAAGMHNGVNDPSTGTLGRVNDPTAATLDRVNDPTAGTLDRVNDHTAGMLDRVNDPTVQNYDPAAFWEIPYDEFHMRGIRARNPSLIDDRESALLVHIPTLGNTDPVFSFAARRTSNGQRRLRFDVASVPGDVIEKYLSTVASLTEEEFEEAYTAVMEDIAWSDAGMEVTGARMYEAYKRVEIPLDGLEEAEDNPDLWLRIRFDGDPEKRLGMEGNIRFNNMIMKGRKDTTGTGDPTGTDQDPDQVPEQFRLLQNYPNPFNATTVIRYTLPVDNDVRLDVFDVLGRRVTTLVDDRLRAGEHRLTFDGSNLASGVYIYRLQSGDYAESRQMLLVK